MREHGGPLCGAPRSTIISGGVIVTLVVISCKLGDNAGHKWRPCAEPRRKDLCPQNLLKGWKICQFPIPDTAPPAMKVVLQQCQALSKSCIQEVTQVQLMHQKIVLLWEAARWLKSVTWHLNFSVNHCRIATMGYTGKMTSLYWSRAPHHFQVSPAQLKIRCPFIQRDLILHLYWNDQMAGYQYYSHSNGHN